MGLIDIALGTLFGGGRNVLRETAGIFAENAEAGADRAQALRAAALAQHASEFRETRTRFDCVIDGLNRLPRPAMAFGAIGLFVAAMADPIWFASRMQGLALVPEALWWLMGAVVSFYFGARHQAKGQEFQRDIANTMARVPQVAANLALLRGMQEVEAPGTTRLAAGDPNPALEEWRRVG